MANFTEVPWAAAQATELGLQTREGADPAEIPALASAHDWTTTLVDSYLVTAADLSGLRTPLAVIDDEATRPLPADLVLNQNLTAIEADYSDWGLAAVLRGPEFALLRPRVAAARRADGYPERQWTGRPQRVLIVLGGTDPGDGVTAMVRLALAGLAPVELKVIASSEAALESVRAVPVPAGSSVEATAPVLAIEELMTWADLVLSAAGSTVWELCCLGVPMALVTVAENQEHNYRLALEAGLAVGLGALADVVSGQVTALPSVLRSEAVNELGARAWKTVDGLGADRVARAVLALK